MLTAYGLWVLASGQAIIKARYGGVMSLTGYDAMLYGSCALALAAVIHCFTAWPRFDRLAEYAGVAAGISLVIFVALLGSLIARQFLNFV